MMYTAKTIVHRNQKRIAVYFDNDATLIARFKKIGGAQWSATLKVWHLPDTAENRKKFNLDTAPKSELNGDKLAAIEKFSTYLCTKRYSSSTIKTYTESLSTFFLFYNDKETSKINNNDVINFQNNYILAKKLSISYQNQIHPVG